MDQVKDGLVILCPRGSRGLVRLVRREGGCETELASCQVHNAIEGGEAILAALMLAEGEGVKKAPIVYY